MAQYIQVYMDGDKGNYKNKGLYDIIVFIGEQSSSGKKHLSYNNAYKNGKKIINSRLHKWHMTTIERLVVADKIRHTFNYEHKTTKPVWRIHRSKAKKVFVAIRSILNKYNNSDVLILFDDICKKYSLTSGADAAGAPYYDVINEKNLLISQRYNNADIEDLLNCAGKIEEFSKYH